MNLLGIIPSRYQSTRFPGKPLAMIHGKSMIRRVYEQAAKAKSLSRVIVATDDAKIFDHVKQFGGEVMMTKTSHTNGTSRCQEVLQKLEKENPDFKTDAVINIQGDEPYIKPEQIDVLASLFTDSKTDIATLVKMIDNYDDLFDANTVKAVLNINGFALLFSRQTIPFNRDEAMVNWLNTGSYYKHLGIYGYRSDVLNRLALLEPSPLEKLEKLEQLRWLENGYRIKAAITDFDTISVDTPEDLNKLKDVNKKHL